MKKTSILLVLIALFGLALVSNFIVRPQTTDAAGDLQLSGYAWSPNIGWISFKDAGGDVKIKPDGYFNGYAWSSNIGWIKFDQNIKGQNTGAQAGTGGSIADNTIVTGWAQAVTPAENPDTSGGWDGWISLSGSTYGVKKITDSAGNQRFTGYGWGSDVVGWVNFDPEGVGETPPGCVPTPSNDCGGVIIDGAYVVCQVTPSVAKKDDQVTWSIQSSSGTKSSPINWTGACIGSGATCSRTIPSTAVNGNTFSAQATVELTGSTQTITCFPATVTVNNTLIPPIGGNPSVVVTNDKTYIFGQSLGQAAISSPPAKINVTGSPFTLRVLTIDPRIPGASPAQCRLKSSTVDSGWSDCTSFSFGVTADQILDFSVKIPNYNPAITQNSPYDITLGVDNSPLVVPPLQFQYKVSAPVNI